MFPINCIPHSSSCLDGAKCPGTSQRSTAEGHMTSYPDSHLVVDTLRSFRFSSPRDNPGGERHPPRSLLIAEGCGGGHQSLHTLGHNPNCERPIWETSARFCWIRSIPGSRSRPAGRQGLVAMHHLSPRRTRSSSTRPPPPPTQLCSLRRPFSVRLPYFASPTRQGASAPSVPVCWAVLRAVLMIARCQVEPP